MKKLILGIILVLFNFQLWAQRDSTIILNENLLEPIIDRIESMEGETQTISEDWIEETILFDDHSFDLNHLSWESAVTLLHFSDYQYYQLQLYIEEFGEMVSVYELLAVDGFSREDFQRLLPYIKVEPSQKRLYFLKNFFKYSRNNLWIRYGRTLEKAVGYDTSRTSHYLGSPMRLSFRYAFNTQDKLFVKFAGEKDAGEQFFRGEQKQGFDFYSGSVCLKDIGVLKTVVLGDFRLNFGQGLVAGSSMLSGKGFGVSGLRKFQTAVRAIAPANESEFLRGGAAVIGNTKFTGTAFAAKRIGQEGSAFGADFLYRHSLFKIGMRAIGTINGKPPANVQLYQMFSHEKESRFNFGMDYQAIVKKQLLFGEIAINECGRIGAFQGAIFHLTPVAKLAVLLRYYDKKFKAPLGKAFGTSSSNSGEAGCFLSGEYILGRNVDLNVYFDYYRLLWLSYHDEAPASGTDAGASMKYQINRYSNLTFSYWFKFKEENAAVNAIAPISHYRTIQERHRHKVRLAFTYQFSPCISAKTQFEGLLNFYPAGKSRDNHLDTIPEYDADDIEDVGISSNQDIEIMMDDNQSTNPPLANGHGLKNNANLYKGILLYQDLAFDFPRIGLALRLRIAYFDTDRYDERLYAYEHDVYYAFTIGNYYYKGFRAYMVLRYRYEWFSIWLRLARTHYLDKQSVGSGLDQINKPHKTDCRLQVMFSF